MQYLDLNIWQYLFLAIVQGLTEFWPISSSAQLLIPSLLWGWEDQGRTFDVAVHFGTLLAVMHKARGDWIPLLIPNHRSVRTFLWLSIATVPLLASGLLLVVFIDEAIRVAWVVGMANIFFAIWLYKAERVAQKKPSDSVFSFSESSFWQALKIGMFQALAVIPGASRSGLVMTGGYASNLSQADTIRIVLMLSIPAILAATTFELWTIDETLKEHISVTHLLLFTAVAGVVAWLAIDILIRLMRTWGTVPFVVYRLILGAILITVPQTFS